MGMNGKLREAVDDMARLEEIVVHGRAGSKLYGDVTELHRQLRALARMERLRLPFQPEPTRELVTRRETYMKALPLISRVRRNLSELGLVPFEKRLANLEEHTKKEIERLTKLLYRDKAR